MQILRLCSWVLNRNMRHSLGWSGKELLLLLCQAKGAPVGWCPPGHVWRGQWEVSWHYPGRAWSAGGQSLHWLASRWGSKHHQPLGVSQSRVYALLVRSFHLEGGLLPVKTASECVSSPYLFFSGHSAVWLSYGLNCYCSLLCFYILAIPNHWFLSQHCTLKDKETGACFVRSVHRSSIYIWQAIEATKASINRRVEGTSPAAPQSSVRLPTQGASIPVWVARIPHAAQCSQ